jgi:DNA uptake protein ComE-like DNA-binding protein
MKKLRRSKHAFVLVAVLIVIMLASMVAVSLLFRLHAEETAAAAGAGSEQAWTAAMSGISTAISVVSQVAPGSIEWQDAPEIFRERLLFDDGSDRWYFTVYTMGDAERQEIRFGLSDEASKLNVNNATEAMLGRLPRVTPYLAQGLLDFLDADDAPRPFGAEQEYYDALARPYAIRNGPLSTLEELLLVRGFTPALLFGEDANLNYQLDPNEDDGDEQFPPDNHDGRLDHGLRPYLTVSSYDLNEDNEGIPRTDLNDPQDTFPTGTVTNSLVQYILALRRNNIKLTHPADLLEAKGKFSDEKGKEVEMESGVGKKELAALLDQYTTTIHYHLPGLINLNTASVQVLQTLPEIDEPLAEAIISARRDLRPEQRRTPAWLYEDDLVNAERFKKIAPYLTARGFQYHFHVIGYGLPSGRYRVLEAMIDLGGLKPAITYLRDITRLGLPFKIDGSGGALAAGKGSRGRTALASSLTPESFWGSPSKPKEVPHG